MLVTLEDESAAIMPIQMHARIVGIHERDRRSVPDRERLNVGESSGTDVIGIGASLMMNDA